MSIYHLTTPLLFTIFLMSMLTAFLNLYVLYIARFMRDQKSGVPLLIYAAATLIYVISNYLFVSFIIYYRSVFVLIESLIYFQWTAIFPLIASLIALLPGYCPGYPTHTKIIFVFHSFFFALLLLAMGLTPTYDVFSYIALQLFLLFEGVYWIRQLRNGTINSLTNWDIKHAFERIDVPIWTVRQSGLIQMENPAAHRAKRQLALYSGDDMNTLITKLKEQANQEVLQSNLMADDLHLRFSNKSYMLRKKSFVHRYKNYSHYHLYDITELDKRLIKLEELNKQLTEGNKHLEKVIKNLASMVYSQERIKARINMHDILGQRLAILRIGTEYMLKNKAVLPQCSHDDLICMVDGILKDLRNEPDVSDPIAYMNTLRETFSMINVNIFSYNLKMIRPEDRSLICQILRESATNSVRHGQATAIYYFYESVTHCLFVQDNGLPPFNKHFHEGTGLSTMRNKIEAIGGKIDYTLDDSGFLLLIQFPSDKTNES